MIICHVWVVTSLSQKMNVFYSCVFNFTFANLIGSITCSYEGHVWRAMISSSTLAYNVCTVMDMCMLTCAHCTPLLKEAFPAGFLNHSSVIKVKNPNVREQCCIWRAVARWVDSENASGPLQRPSPHYIHTLKLKAFIKKFIELSEMFSHLWFCTNNGDLFLLVSDGRCCPLVCRVSV